jgi:hypothetical protein
VGKKEREREGKKRGITRIFIFSFALFIIGTTYISISLRRAWGWKFRRINCRNLFKENKGTNTGWLRTKFEKGKIKIERER